MKIITIFFLLLLLLPMTSAVEFDMKTEFSQGETLMAKVSGNFLEPILKENIFFYRGHVRISINPEVAKIDDEFYIYAPLLGKNPDNYSISIENIRYMKGSQVSEEDIVKNFSITQGMADFSITPGFIISKNDFFIEAQNLQDYQITVQIKTDSPSNGGFFAFLFEDAAEENSVILKSGEIKKINFELENITQPTLKTIELSTENLKYEIPVYVYLYLSEKESNDSVKEKKFELEPLGLNISISTNSNTTRIIYLYNTGDATLENISLSVSDSLKPYLCFSIDEIEELNENSSIKIELYLSSDDEEKTIEGQIKAKEDNLYTYSAIFLNFIKDYVPSDDEEEIITTIKTCEEMTGIICEEDEECDGESEYAKDGKCCLGTCEEIKESSTGKIIGWSIVILVIAFVIWFFKAKYRGAKKEVDLFKIAKGKK